MTSASAAYNVSRMISMAGVDGSDRYDDDGGGGDTREGDGGEILRLSGLRRSLGGTAGGVSRYLC